MQGLPARLSEARDRKGWTQAHLAARARLSKSFLSDLENGKRGLSAENLRSLCLVLEVSADWLLGLANGPLPAEPTNTERALGEALRELEERRGWQERVKRWFAECPAE